MKKNLTPIHRQTIDYIRNEFNYDSPFAQRVIDGIPHCENTFDLVRLLSSGFVNTEKARMHIQEEFQKFAQNSTFSSFTIIHGIDDLIDVPMAEHGLETR
jgi:hypothetical protein